MQGLELMTVYDGTPMIALELAVVLCAVFAGARLGGVGIGFAGGVGVLILSMMGIAPGSIPLDVISIIMSVISAISAMQAAGGMDFLVRLTEKILRKNPRYITVLSPVVTYFLTIFAGTGNISLSALPVIIEVAKDHGIRPCRPLSVSVVSAQLAITASPVSAAVVYMASLLEDYDVSYLKLLLIALPSTFLASVAMSFVISLCFNSRLCDDPVCLKRLEEVGALASESLRREMRKGAKTSVALFFAGVVLVVLYAVINSQSVGIVQEPVMSTTYAISVIMLTAAFLICVLCRADTDSILGTSTFRSGMSACICIFGVAWLGDTFVSANIEWIEDTAGIAIRHHPWLLSVIFLFSSALLYSQAATAKALMPLAFSLCVSPLTAIASFPAVSGLFILPTYPTLIASVQMDDTGSTRIGRLVFNHPFFIPGILGVVFSVALGFLFGGMVL